MSGNRSRTEFDRFRERTGIPSNRRPSARGKGLSFVDQLLNFPDGRVVDGLDRLAAGRAFHRAPQAHGLVADVEIAAADRAIGLSPDVIEFMRHWSAYTPIAIP